MRDEPCPSCGAKVGRGAARCPSCGSELDLRVVPLAGEAAEGADIELGRGRSRWWGAAAAVVLVGLLGAAAIAAGDRAPRAADTTTTTTALPTTSSPSTTVVRPTTIAPSTTTTTLPQRMRLGAAPYLEASAPPSVVLHGLSRRRDALWRVDLLTGDTTVRPLVADRREAYDGPDTLIPRTGGVVRAAWDKPVTFFPDDPALPERVLGVGSAWPMPHTDPSLVWMVLLGGFENRVQVVDLDGAVVAGPIEIPSGYPLGDDGTGRLLVQVGNAIYAMGADGTATRVAVGGLSAWSADRLAALECAPTEIRCDLVARARPGDEELGRAPASRSVVDGASSSGVLSPSGNTLAVVGYTTSGTTIDLVHFDGRETVSYGFMPGPWGGPVGSSQPPVWWVDDSLLCGLEEPGGVRCWRDGDLQATFQLGDMSPSGFASVAISRW